MITFLAPLVAKFSLRFGPPEFFAVQLLTFCSFVGLGKGHPAKTIAAMMLGFALAAVGLDTVTGTLRMTFGTHELLRGFDFLIAVIGLFGIGEILLTMEEGLAFKGVHARINPRVVWQTWKQLPQYWLTALRRHADRLLDGHHPGRRDAGVVRELRRRQAFPRMAKNSAPARWKAWSRRKPRHAAGTNALLPMLTLGIPGSPTAAVLLGGLLIWDLQAGPLLLRRTEGLRLGPDREHVSRQHRRPDHRADDGAVVGGDPARAVFPSLRRSLSWSARSAPTPCTTRCWMSR